MILPVGQGKMDSCQVYMDRYDNGMRVIQLIGGKLPVHPALVDADLKEKAKIAIRPVLEKMRI